MSRITLMFALLLPVAVLACEKAEPKVEATPPAASAPLTDEELDQTNIPVKEDFEEEAITTIHEDNLEAEVDRLEKQIEADNP